MNKGKKFLKLISDKNFRTDVLSRRGFYKTMPDEEFLNRIFKARMGEELDLKNPQTFNQKLQWLKINNRKSEFTMMADKFLVRDYISKKLGKEYLIPLIGVWDKAEDINFDELPNQFVLKCNHNSGLGMCICKDKSKLDIEKVKKELTKGLEQDYYLSSREWVYKDIPRKIICEKYMVDESGYELKDYKFMCFDGEVKLIFVCSERKEGLKVTFFDRFWKKMNFQRHYPNSTKGINKPKSLEKMIEFAEILGKDIAFSRIDFYDINGQVYFGEITFFPGSGLEEFTPSEWDYTIGSWIDLTK